MPTMYLSLIVILANFNRKLKNYYFILIIDVGETLQKRNPGNNGQYQ